MRLLIISHVIHYEWEGEFWAYGPYALEINVWAEIFEKITIASPLRRVQPPGDCVPFSAANIQIAPQPERGGNNIAAKVYQLISLPVMIGRLVAAIREADAVHVRCPGNLGLLGILLVPLFSKYRIAKYAGQWGNYLGEANSFRLQRWLLRSKWWNAPVTVYGNWPDQPAHVKSFFTSILTEDQIALAKQSAAIIRPRAPLRVLYVGRLSKAKNVDAIILALKELAEEKVPFECRIVGIGPEFESLKNQVNQFGINTQVAFTGGLPFSQVLENYAWADVSVLISETEGWPKALTEAMAFGLVCISSNRGLIPQLLQNKRGIVIEPGDASQLEKELLRLHQESETFHQISTNASQWAQQFSLPGLKQALIDLMVSEWNITESEFRGNSFD